MNKTLVIASIALVVALVGLFFPQVAQREVVAPIVNSLGASGSGQDTTSPQSFLAGIAVGGVYATSTAGNAVLPGTAMDDESTIIVLPTAATTLTLPASTTLMNVIPKMGMRKTYTIFNRGTSTVALTLAGSTGVTLKKASSTVVAGGISTGDNGFILTITRLFNGNVAAFVSNLGS